MRNVATMTTRVVEEFEPTERVDVAARIPRTDVERLDALARERRWSRSQAIAWAVEQLVAAQPANATSWDAAEVRG